MERGRWQGTVWGTVLLALGLPLAGEGAVKQPVPPLPAPSAGACRQIQNLAERGFIRLPAGYQDVENAHFTREEMTNLTLQAMERLGMDAHGKIGGQPGDTVPGGKETLALRQEFYRELRNRGMIEDGTLLTDMKPSSEASDERKDEDRKYKFSAELRYNYVKHSGSPRWDWRDSCLRARLFLEAKLNDKWHAYGMGEINHHFLSHHKQDDWLENRRIYVRGMMGDAIVTAGMYGLELGEGNIYSSTAKGVTVNWGDRPEFKASAGETKADGKFASYGVAMKRDPVFYGAAVHLFDKDDWDHQKRIIWDGYYNYNLKPDLQAGLMLLGADKSFGDGKHMGFVAKLVRGRIKSWIRGSQEWDLRYYYQPSGTYIVHTMSGLADYMTGFRGLGFQYQYTLVPNIVLNAEYYDLKELATGDRGRTLWLDVTWFMG